MINELRTKVLSYRNESVTFFRDDPLLKSTNIINTLNANLRQASEDYNVPLHELDRQIEGPWKNKAVKTQLKRRI